jgi:hypothetical protein
MKNAHLILMDNLKERDHFGDLCVDGRISLKSVLSRVCEVKAQDKVKWWDYGTWR